MKTKVLILQVVECPLLGGIQQRLAVQILLSPLWEHLYFLRLLEISPHFLRLDLFMIPGVGKSTSKLRSSFVLFNIEILYRYIVYHFTVQIILYLYYFRRFPLLLELAGYKLNYQRCCYECDLTKECMDL